MMEKIAENNAAAGENFMPAASLGKLLREAREHFGLSVTQVSSQIKIAPRQIEALETDDFQNLPEAPFVRGFVRSYAKLLNLDAKPLLALLPDFNPVNAMPAPVEVLSSGVYTLQRHNIIWLGAALLLAVLVVAFAVWNFSTPPAAHEKAGIETSQPLATAKPDQLQPASSAIPVESAAPPVAALPQSSVPEQVPAANVKLPQADAQIQSEVPAATLRLVFSAKSWVEIRDKDGKILSSQLNLPGSELKLNGAAPFSLTIGHALAVQLYHRGMQVDLAPYINTYSEVARLTLK